MNPFAGRVAFITGAASGAGFGQAVVFGRAGARIVVADVREAAVEEAVDRLRAQGIEAWGIPLDVTDRVAYAAAADAAESHFGDPVTLLFNTAGVNGFGSAETLTFADYDWLLGVNLGGVVNGMVTFVPRMIEAGRGGHVASVASVGGLEGGLMTAPYSAAKAGVISLMESYAKVLPRHGIGVTVLCPANIRSNIATSHDLRPGDGGDTGIRTDEQFVSALTEVHRHGMEPETLALHLKHAMEAGELYAIPYPEVREDLERKFGSVLDAVPVVDPLAPGGSEARTEALRQFRRVAAEGGGRSSK
ncbi:SDR family NAD(P)-dependent oxidoreductase [Microbacterium lushaniae]|uniref:SDR family NAD(P)-dependent oxidoreductase n=1 Tax=Microbacterium lushaniae TaxID=2614639 RepID=A0A5J6L7M5_9MICO|nr:SDR family NAD(P)-dependent oxidoreductase [Microbacterium lushaniae]QEW04534.1 SDR family NAD(P)-dependent oxidoreductase [Microbacterium lushaniae]